MDAIVPQITEQGSTSLQLSGAQQEEVRKIALSISLDPSNTTGIMQFGSQVQQHTSQLADTMLQNIRAKDMGEVGETLSKLMLKCKSIDVKDFSNTKKEGLLHSIPILGKLIDKGKSALAKYEKIEDEIEAISTSLQNAHTQLVSDVALLDAVYANNENGFMQLELHILGAMQRLAELSQEIIPQALVAAQGTNNPMDVQHVQNLNQLKDRLEKKINDLQITKMIAIQTAPQIRLIQGNNMLLAEKIQSSILNTIPLWKQSLVIRVTLMRQSSAVELQKNVSDTTNDLLKGNADLLKQGAISIAKEGERGIVDIATLEHVNNQLISTVDEIEKIRIEGKKTRGETEQKLVQLQGQLKARLLK